MNTLLSSLLQRYLALSQSVRLGCTATLGALIGLVTYEIIYFVMPVEPRATLSWSLGFLIGVVRQHGLHRLLTYTNYTGDYWSSLRRAYVMYSASLLTGTVLNWWLTELLAVHHRIAWLCCLLVTMLLSFILLNSYVFKSKIESLPE